MDRPLGLIGVPSELGANRKGTAKAPSVIINQVLPKLGHAIDLGSIDAPKTAPRGSARAKHLKAIGKVCDDFCARSLSPHVFPVIIGGDHSVTYCVVRKLAQKSRMGLIYLDAHGDFNTPKTTPSGNVHGMVLSGIVGKLHSSLLHQNRPLIPQKNIVLIGTRDLDLEEKRELAKSNITLFSPSTVRKMGPSQLMKRAVAITAKTREGFHLSIDIDVVDKKWVLGTSTPSSGGITPKELKALVAEALRHKILSMDIMEYNPIHDPGKKTLKLLEEILILVDKAR